MSNKLRRGAVIGDPVEHSKSPLIHNAAIKDLGLSAVFESVQVKRGEVETTLRKMESQNYFGVSVTVPHKLEALEVCDELSYVARSVGAVNCVSFYEGRLVGHNTDSEGFTLAAEAGGFSIEGAKVVILGAGGAARAVAHGLEAEGAQITVLARSPREVVWKNCQAFDEKTLGRELVDAQMVVDCTPTGLVERGDEMLPAKVPLDLLPKTAVVASLVYHREPELLVKAAALNLETMNGKEMLFRQGALAFEIWFEEEPSLDDMRAAF